MNVLFSFHVTFVLMLPSPFLSNWLKAERNTVSSSCVMLARMARLSSSVTAFSRPLHTLPLYLNYSTIQILLYIQYLYSVMFQKPYIFGIQYLTHFQNPNIFGIRSNFTVRDNTAAHTVTLSISIRVIRSYLLLLWKGILTFLNSLLIILSR